MRGKTSGIEGEAQQRLWGKATLLASAGWAALAIAFIGIESMYARAAAAGLVAMDFLDQRGMDVFLGIVCLATIGSAWRKHRSRLKGSMF